MASRCCRMFGWYYFCGSTRACSATRYQEGTYFFSNTCSTYRVVLDGTRTGSILDDTHGFNRRSGGEAPIWTTYERLAVEACLEQLKNHGYFVPDFSYFRVKQLQARESNVILTIERFCRLNQQDRV